MPVERAARLLSTSLCRQCAYRFSILVPQRAFIAHSTRPPVSVSNEAGQHDNDMAKSMPRWAQTPPAMKAPFKARPLNDNDDYPVNEDPKVLDEVYKHMLGQDGDRVLTEEVKWLAVTHKSFDHGRRGFNDRLAFLGKRIVSLQTSLALLDATPDPSRAKQYPEQEQESTDDKALFNVENITRNMKSKILSEARLDELARRYRLHTVIRWKPRLTKDLHASGEPRVLASTLYAIVGAIALQKGGEEARRIARERILSPLGF